MDDPSHWDTCNIHTIPSSFASLRPATVNVWCMWNGFFFCKMWLLRYPWILRGLFSRKNFSKYSWYSCWEKSFLTSPSYLVGIFCVEVFSLFGYMGDGTEGACMHAPPPDVVLELHHCCFCVAFLWLGGVKVQFMTMNASLPQELSCYASLLVGLRDSHCHCCC